MCYIYISIDDINRTYHENFKQKCILTVCLKDTTGWHQLANKLTFWKGICRSSLFQTFLSSLSMNFSLLQFAKIDTKTNSCDSQLTCGCYWAELYFREDYKQIGISPNSPFSMISWPVVMWQLSLTALARRRNASGSRFSNLVNWGLSVGRP